MFAPLKTGLSPFGMFLQSSLFAILRRRFSGFRLSLAFT
jgi:hypothetical protein